MRGSRVSYRFIPAPDSWTIQNTESSNVDTKSLKRRRKKGKGKFQRPWFLNSRVFQGYVNFMHTLHTCTHTYTHTHSHSHTHTPPAPAQRSSLNYSSFEVLKPSVDTSKARVTLLIINQTSLLTTIPEDQKQLHWSLWQSLNNYQVLGTVLSSTFQASPHLILTTPRTLVLDARFPDQQHQHLPETC